jgi:hypothetical protein
MRGHPGSPEAFEEALGQGACGKGNGIQALERFLEAGVDSEVRRYLPEIDHPVLTARQSVGEQTWIPESSGEGFSGQACQIPQCGNTKPTESVDQLLSVETLPECSKIESG